MYQTKPCRLLLFLFSSFVQIPEMLRYTIELPYYDAYYSEKQELRRLSSRAPKQLTDTGTQNRCGYTSPIEIGVF